MKLLAFDLDGTVVTRDHRLPERIRDAIRRAEDAGHTVTVITGRSELSARPYLEALGISQPFGTSQGARIATADGEIVLETRLSADTVRGILEKHAHGADSYFFSAGERFYVAEPEHERWDWARTEGHNVTGFHAYTGESAEKIFFSGSDVAALHLAMREAFPELMYYPWDEQFLEVTMTGAHKGEALRHIAEKLGFEREDVIAFGDGLNDVSMLEWAGRGIAVGTADPRALEVSDEHIPGPEENGVALWIEQHLL